MSSHLMPFLADFLVTGLYSVCLCVYGCPSASNGSGAIGHSPECQHLETPEFMHVVWVGTPGCDHSLHPERLTSKWGREILESSVASTTSLGQKVERLKGLKSTSGGTRRCRPATGESMVLGG